VRTDLLDQGEKGALADSARGERKRKGNDFFPFREGRRGKKGIEQPFSATRCKKIVEFSLGFTRRKRRRSNTIFAEGRGRRRRKGVWAG